ncbi:MAG: hypothetical protein JNK23_16365 [Opitutaceae bacterium]|nr:hypothetical protein [Opitutaceae bacterium]
MKNHPSASRLYLTALLGAFAVAATSGLAADAKKKQPDPYPLTTCLVAGDPLGASDYVTYVHKEAGKPDRTIRLCCDGCIDDFKKEPAKFLAKLDAAEAEARAKAKSGKAKKS